jgi:putative ABC transport system substrate-binding protein
MWFSTVGSIITLLLSLLVAPLAAEAQPPGKVFRIGVLSFSVTAGRDRSLDGLQQGLRALGYVEGQNLAMEQRDAEGHSERLPALATTLVDLQVEVLVALGAAATRAAQRATSTLPIVMVTSVDPVASGFIASLARPSGNITGVSSVDTLGGKRLELLKEAVPTVSRIAALWNPGNPAMASFVHEAQGAAQALGVQLHVLAGPPNDFEGAFTATSSGRAEALIVLPDASFTNHATRIVDFAHRHRLPAIYPVREFVDAGGLMSYGLSWPDMGRRAATLVDKILKGATPADLPVEQAMKFALVMNLKAAQELGLTLPPHLLVFADEVLR